MSLYDVDHASGLTRLHPELGDPVGPDFPITDDHMAEVVISGGLIARTQPDERASTLARLLGERLLKFDSATAMLLVQLRVAIADEMPVAEQLERLDAVETRVAGWVEHITGANTPAGPA